MDGPFSFSEAPAEYLDFLQQKRREMIGLVFGAIAIGAGEAVLVAALRGDAAEAIPGVQAAAALLVVTVLGLGAYGFTQGGSEREL